MALAAMVAGLASPIARATEPDTRTPVYIALGDSYTSAPLLSKPVGKWGGSGPGYSNPENPYTCGKSDRNYPHLIAQHLGLYDPNDLTKELGEHPDHPGFIDISCGSARTKHINEAEQTGLPGGGTNPTQLDAFDADQVDPLTEVVTLVTLGIGGNDLGFGELHRLLRPAPEAAGGTPCRTHYENAGGMGDPPSRATSSSIARCCVHDSTPCSRRSTARAEAEVLVFGYPALLPEHRAGLPEALADGCYPYIPILPTDAAYLRDVEKDLNTTIRLAAEAAGRRQGYAHYVDWYTPSIGHDMCQPPGSPG